MSKLLSYLFLLVVVGLGQTILAQTFLDAEIVIDGQSATVSGKYQQPVEKLRFLDSYAGISGLASRITGVDVRDFAGETQDLMPSATGEYLTGGSFSRFGYRVHLEPLTNRQAAARTSWIGDGYGLIMLDDIFPQSSSVRSGVVRLKLPAGWSVAGTGSGASGYSFENADKVAFLISKTRRDLPGDGFDLSILGDWQFTDEDAAKFTAEAVGYYSYVFGGRPPKRAKVNILKFPRDTPPGEWEADTRGNTVTIVSSDAAFKSQSLNRLHEQLRHEVFHLWFPNGVNLSGNYDWFYEGFALYQSLKLGVAVNRIRFDDYLDTLSRAYNIDIFGTKRVSLIDASKNRFSGNNTAVYARGMLVAFLCDLAMLDASKGKRSTDGLVKEIFQMHPLSSPRVDGNEAILSIMKQRPELTTIADRYVTGAEVIDWAALLNIAGLEFTQNGREKALKIVERPSGQQKTILDKLGYNNWRKVGSK